MNSKTLYSYSDHDHDYCRGMLAASYTLTYRCIVIQGKDVLLPLGVLPEWLTPEWHDRDEHPIPACHLPLASSRVAHSQVGGESQGRQRRWDDNCLQDA